MSLFGGLESRSVCGADRKKVQIELVVLYDSHHLAKEAFLIIAALVERFSNNSELFCQLVSFDALASPFSAARAARTAQDADLLIVAVRCKTDLPRLVKQWLHRCISHKEQRSGGLAALLECPDLNAAAQVRTREFLRALAESRRLDFFLHELELPEPAGDFARVHDERWS